MLAKIICSPGAIHMGVWAPPYVLENDLSIGGILVSYSRMVVSDLKVDNKFKHTGSIHSRASHHIVRQER